MARLIADADGSCSSVTPSASMDALFASAREGMRTETGTTKRRTADSRSTASIECAHGKGRHALYRQHRTELREIPLQGCARVGGCAVTDHHCDEPGQGND